MADRPDAEPKTEDAARDPEIGYPGLRFPTRTVVTFTTSRTVTVSH